MAGHSKFKNIMYRKGAQDARRSKLFSKLSKEITVAAKMGGMDADANARLRLAIQTARAQSMPKDNIERAIRKSQGSEGETYEEVRYEGYGPGGVALIVESLTDNRNRTAATVRALFTRSGGSLAESGAVSFMFERVGEISYPLAAGSAEEVLDAAIEAGAVDVVSDNDGHTITTEFTSLSDVAGTLESLLGEAEGIEPVWKPQTPIDADADTAGKVMKLIAGLEDDDDVQAVFSSMEVSDQTLAALAEA